MALVGLSVTLLVTGALHQSEQRRAAILLERQAMAVEAAVTAEANRYVDTLTDLTAAIGAQTDLSAEDFAAIMAGLSTQRLYGASGVSLVLPSSTATLPDLNQVWPGTAFQADPLAAGGVQRGSPAVVAPPHRYVVLSKTLDGSAPRIGRDVRQVVPVREAMDHALQRGKPTASRTFVFRKDVESLPAARRQLSFVVAAPVRSFGNGPLRGWLVMGMRGEDFLQRTLERTAAGQVAVELRDVDGLNSRRVASWPAGQSSLLARAGLAGRAGVTERDGGGGMRPVIGSTLGVEHKWVQVAGRTWLLSVAPLDGFRQPDTRLDTFVLVTGTVIGLLLAALVGTLTRSRDRALTAVSVATTALRADVARREQAEVELRRRERELAGFAGVAAHDLRTPLAAASAYLEVLADESTAELAPRNQEFLGRARSAVSRTDRLLTDLLGYATADQVVLQHTRVDLGMLAADVVAERTDRLAEDPHRVAVGELPVVDGDPGMLRQVLDNLIGNALKYTTPGSSPRVTVTAQRTESGWRIEVTDRGIGVPAEERDGVFDAFQRGGDSGGYSGSGLGLAICRRIVERHGGTIGVTSGPSGGSQFWFTLPEVPLDAA